MSTPARDRQQPPVCEPATEEVRTAVAGRLAAADARRAVQIARLRERFGVTDTAA